MRHVGVTLGKVNYFLTLLPFCRTWFGRRNRRVCLFVTRRHESVTLSLSSAG